MKKFWSIAPIILFCGCAEVQEVATKVVTDPNVIAAVKTAGAVAIQSATYSNPEIAAVATAGVALATAVGALVKAFKKAK